MKTSVIAEINAGIQGFLFASYLHLWSGSSWHKQHWPWKTTSADLWPWKPTLMLSMWGLMNPFLSRSRIWTGPRRGLPSAKAMARTRWMISSHAFPQLTRSVSRKPWIAWKGQFSTNESTNNSHTNNFIIWVYDQASTRHGFKNIGVWNYTFCFIYAFRADLGIARLRAT